MTNDQIKQLIADAGISDMVKDLPSEHLILIIERLSNQISKESIDICKKFIDIYTDPTNYKDSWYIDSKIDAFKQVKKAIESRYKKEQVVIEIEDKQY